MNLMMHFSIIILAYLLGSIPTSFLFGKARNIDLRQHGSGNVGATNALRILGVKTGIITLLIDIAKGFLAVHLTRIFLVGSTDLYLIAVGLAAILGHIFTIFLNFKGGKGVATSAGVFLALAPLASAFAFLVFIIIVVLTKYVSLGSLLAALTLVVAELIININNDFQHLPVLILAGLIGIFIFIRHRANISRIRQGKENKISFRRKQ